MSAAHKVYVKYRMLQTLLAYEDVFVHYKDHRRSLNNMNENRFGSHVTVDVSFSLSLSLSVVLRCRSNETSSY